MKVGIPDRPSTIEDVYLYEEYLQVSIVIIGARASNRKVYTGSPKFEDKIFLYHSGEPPNTHFDTIVKVNGLLNKSYYCDYCDKGFQNRNGHKCAKWCNVCGRDNCEGRVNLAHVLTAIKFADHQTALQNTEKGKEGREV